jgi:hypothetical protein
MGVNERRGSERMHGAKGIGVVLLAAATIGCGGATAGGADGATEAVVATAANDLAGGLVELQAGLPTGYPGVWYTQRLAALDYRVSSLRRDEGGAAVYRVAKGQEAFEVRVALDEESEKARTVEIVPLTGDLASDDDGATAEPGPTSAQEPIGSRRDGEVASPESSGERRDAGVATNGAHAEAADEPVIQPRAPAPVAEPSAPEPVAGPRAPEPTERRTPEAVAEPRAPEPVYEPAPAPPPAPRRYVVTVAAGSRIAARLDGALSSGTAEVGDAFAMTARESVWADGIEVIPAGSIVWGTVAEVERAGRPNKGGRIVLVANAVQIGSDELPLEAMVTAEDTRLEGRDSAHEDIKEVAVGAGLGGLVGGLLGGKKGVLIGVLAGGGSTFVATKGEEVELTEGTALVVELRRNLEVTLVGPQ